MKKIFTSLIVAQLYVYPITYGAGKCIVKDQKSQGSVKNVKGGGEKR